jgi:hypothetical protein
MSSLPVAPGGEMYFFRIVQEHGEKPAFQKGGFSATFSPMFKNTTSGKGTADDSWVASINRAGTGNPSQSPPSPVLQT